MEYLKNRLKEPSTHLGLLIVAATLAKVFLPQYGLVIDALCGAFGISAAAIPDKQHQ